MAHDHHCEASGHSCRCGCDDRAAGACLECSRGNHALCTDDGRHDYARCECARSPGIHGPNGIGVV